MIKKNQAAWESDELKKMEVLIGNKDDHEEEESVITSGNFKIAEGEHDRLKRLGVLDSEGKPTDDRILE